MQGLTITNLMQVLKERIQGSIKDLMLEEKTKQGEQRKRRTPVVFVGGLPSKDSETQQVPYILIKALTGTDSQQTGQEEESECKLRIIVVTYSESPEEGYMDTLNVIDRIRLNLLQERVVGSQFILKMPLEFIIYEDDIKPYSIGELITTFEMPAIRRRA